MSNFFETFATFRLGFRQQNLKPPVAVEFASSEDGFKFLQVITGEAKSITLDCRLPWATPIVGPDGRHWLELPVTIMGIKVRWPVN